MYLLEKNLGHGPQYLRIGWMFSKEPSKFLIKVLWSFFKKALNFGGLNIPDIRIGQGNTAIEVFENRFFALHEASLPFQVDVSRDGSFSSLGYFNFGNTLTTACTAHPKVDFKTGEMRFFCYDLSAKNDYVTYHVVKNDRVIVKMAIGPPFLHRKVMMHDFSITENYSLLIDVEVL